MQLDSTVHADVNNEMLEQPMSEAPQGWGEYFNEKFQEAISSKEVIVETLIYFVVGAIIGFLSKKYLKHVLLALVLLVVIVKGMEWANIGTMSVNWEHVKELTGLSPDDSVTSVTGMLLAWVHTHVRQSIALVIGFLVGAKIG
jgi:uncharacterized membrane protein (Fun14 family)